MNGERQYPLDKPRNVQRVLWVLYTLSAVTLALESLVHRHVEHPWEALPGFYPLYGFVGCVSLVLAAKLLRRLIIRPADYYRRRDLPPQPADNPEDAAR